MKNTSRQKKHAPRERADQRQWFIQYWLRYLREHPKEAGEQHTRFINAILKHGKAYPFTAKEYLRGKGEPCNR